MYLSHPLQGPPQRGIWPPTGKIVPAIPHLCTLWSCQVIVVIREKQPGAPCVACVTRLSNLKTKLSICKSVVTASFVLFSLHWSPVTRAKSCQTVVLKTKSVKHCLLFLLKTRIVQWHCLQLLALREDILYKWCWHGTPWCITIICHAVITDNDLNTLISSDHSATGHNSQYLDVSLTGPWSRSSSGQYIGLFGQENLLIIVILMCCQFWQFWYVEVWRELCWCLMSGAWGSGSHLVTWHTGHDSHISYNLQ